MNTVPCMYAIVRFAPFVETGEFANVGIVLMAPAERYFGFKLMNKRYGRVTRFFEQTKPELFRKTLAFLHDELEGKHQLLKQHGFDKRLTNNDVEFAKRVFMEIARPREAIIRFSEVRGVLTESPEAKLQALYKHYVERDFATKEYQEATLERSMRRLLVDAGVINRFAPAKVGNEEIQVPFPFAENANGIIVKAIKPLHLAHDQPSKILEHGGQWLIRTQALKKRKLLPERVLFAVDGPKDGGARERVFAEVVGELTELGVNVTTIANTQRISTFATTS